MISKIHATPRWHRLTKRGIYGVSAALILILSVVMVAQALTVDQVDGRWSNARGADGVPTCLNYNNTAPKDDENQVTYGELVEDGSCPASADVTVQSGFGFEGGQALTFDTWDPFLLGQFTHYNNPINVTNRFQEVDLSVDLLFGDPPFSTTLTYTLQLDETPNFEPCEYGSPDDDPCPDEVGFADTVPVQTFEIDGTLYTLEILGFIPGTVGTCTYDPDQAVNQFITQERQENDACLFARIIATEPAIQVQKDPETQTVGPNETATFTITVQNTGNVTLTNVTVTDPLVPACDNALIGTLGVGETVSYTCDVTATLDFTNVVTATGTPPVGPAVSDDDPAAVDVTPVIGVDKNAEPVEVVAPGGPVSFTVRVDNASGEAVTLTSLVDDIHGNLNGRGNCAVPQTIAAGGFYTCTFTATVTGQVGEQETDTVTAQASDDEGNVTDAEDQATVSIIAAPELVIDKDDGGVTVSAGEIVTYTLRYTNTGQVQATGVTLTETVPQNATFVAGASTAGWSCADGSGAGTLCTLNVGTLTTGESGSALFAVAVDDPFPAGVDGIDNTALIGDDDIPNADEDDDDTPVIASADLEITKTDRSDPVIPGTNLVYELTVTNNGPNAAVGVVVTDTLPNAVTFVDATAPYSYTAPDVRWALGTLALDETRVLTVEVQVLGDVTAVFTNGAQVTSPTPDPVPGNNVADEETTPLIPNLAVAKLVDRPVVARGKPYTYTIVMTNTGEVPFSAVTLTDTLPSSAFHYVAGSGTPADPDVQAEPLLVWQDLGALDPGGSLTVRFQVTTTTSITGTYVNLATAQGVHPGGSVTAEGEVPIDVVRPRVAVDKRLVSADLDDVAPNHLTFTIVITNVGPTPISTLPLRDVYDNTYLSFADATPYPDEDADDGELTWTNLTAAPPNGFGTNLLPGQSFVVNTVFSVVRTIDVTITNTAIVSDAQDIYENEPEEENSDVEIINVPTAVELLYFRVENAQDEQVELAWATALETDNLGFYLYRAPVDDLARASRRAFIPSQAHSGGASYTYTDPVPGAGPWWYWLADVDTSLHEVFHGPVSTTSLAQDWNHHVYLPLVSK